MFAERAAFESAQFFVADQLMGNTAWGGQPSDTFWPILDDAIDYGLPSISVIQGWTAKNRSGMRLSRGLMRPIFFARAKAHDEQLIVAALQFW